MFWNDILPSKLFLFRRPKTFKGRSIGTILALIFRSNFDLFLILFHYAVLQQYYHDIIGVHRPSLKFQVPPPKFRSPFDTKAPGPHLIYLVGPLAISDPHINVCVRPHNTCVALKQFNLLPPNTLL